MGQAQDGGGCRCSSLSHIAAARTKICELHPNHVAGTRMHNAGGSAMDLNEEFPGILSQRYAHLAQYAIAEDENSLSV